MQTLSNGLQVLLVPTPSQVATFNITYRIGSRNEGLCQTGDAHILEHMLFAGSKRYNGANGMWRLEEMGGILNATTYMDRTNFYVVIASHLLPECIAREAGRLTAPILLAERLAKEMTVVRNEYERGRNNPYARMQSRMMNVAFLEHPYRHSTIGYLSDIENVTIDTLKAFHAKYYTVDNATIVVTGNFQQDKVFANIQKEFGDLKPGNLPKQHVVEPEQLGMRRFEEAGPAGILGIGFKAPCGLHPDALNLELLACNINSGESSIFFDLVESGIAYNISASWERVRDPYLFTLWVSAPDPRLAEEHIWKRLQERPAFPAPLEALKRQWTHSCETSQGLASELNEAIARSTSPMDYQDVWDRHNFRHDISQVWQYFVPERSTVGIMLPQTLTKVPTFTRSAPRSAPRAPAAPRAPRAPRAPALQALQAAPQITRTNNGIYALAETPNVYLQIEFTATDSEAVNGLLAEWMTKGTQHKSALEIQTLMDAQGVVRTTEATPNTVLLKYAAPAEALDLILTEITQPALTDSKFHKLQEQHCQRTQSIAFNVDALAMQLLRCNVFEHQSTVKMRTQQLQQTTPQTLKQHHRLDHVKITAIAGNAATLDKCQQLERERATETPLVPVVRPIMQLSQPIANKTSCAVVWGCPVQETPEILLAASILGSGFAGRLMKEVRQERGLTYGIGARYHQGMLTVSSSFSPLLLEQGKNATEEVIALWRHGVSQQELDTHLNMILQRRLVMQDDYSTWVAFLHTNNVSDAALQAVTLEEVNKVIAALPTLARCQTGSF